MQDRKNAWTSIARPNQLMPQKDWRTWLLLAGRGFGKTRSGAEAVVELIKSGRAKSIALIGETIDEVKTIMLPKILDTGADISLRMCTKEIIFNEYGAKARCFSGDRVDSLRGFQFDVVWIDELAKFKYPDEIIAQVSFCLRQGESKLIITTTPRPLQIFGLLMGEHGVIVTKGKSYDNASNLSGTFLQHIEKYKNTPFGLQEIEGEILKNCYWDNSDILYRKLDDSPEKYVLAIDPAISSGTTGIILGAIGKDNNLYIIDDLSTSADPNEWAGLAGQLKKKYGNKLEVCIETNQGGWMAVAMLQRYGIYDAKPIRNVESKDKRFQNAANFYKIQHVYHTKHLKDLEAEMLGKPKDRADALSTMIQHVFTNLATQSNFHLYCLDD
jgi:phage terminase large subunit-like protein